MRGRDKKHMTTQNPVIGLLQRLVRVDSVNTDASGRPEAEREVAELLEKEAASMGLSSRRLPVAGRGFNLLVEHEAGKGRPWVLLYAHMDTVSADGMSVDPFGGEVREGRLYGRGSLDDKGSIASALHALKEYSAQKELPNNAGLLLVVDEEVSHAGAGAFVRDHLPPLGYKPVGIVVCEPTDFTPFVAHNGLMHWTILVKGLAAHASVPEKGRSAISMMAKVVSALEREYISGIKASDPLCGRARCSINRIEGGTSPNIIPDTCRITLDRRVSPGEKTEEILPAVEKVLEGLRKGNPGYGIVQETPRSHPALDYDAKDPFIAGVLGALKGMGMSAEPRGAPFGTDAGIFAKAGLSCVVLGPGDVAKAHQADEYIEVDAVLKGVDVLRGLLRVKV